MKIKSEIIWAILLIGTAAISFYMGSRKGESESKKALRTNIEQKAEKITILENKNQQLSEKLISRGIYNYPQASAVSNEENSLLMVLITLNGNDALQNLELRRKIIPNYSNVSTEELAKYKGTDIVSDLGTLKAHQPAALNVPLTSEEIAINLIYRTQDQRWQQHMRFKQAPNGKVRSFWVITNGDSQVIDKHIDEGFPLDSEGNIVFSKDRRIQYSDIRMNSEFSL